MIGRVLLAALLAGIAAGLIMGAIQHVRLTPLILEAEIYETAGHDTSHASAHDAGQAAAGSEEDTHQHDDEAWAPADGWQRTLGTTVTSVMAGAAFAAMLAGVSLLTGFPITRRNGALWGLCGFLAASLAPSAGLPPELPGMPAADLFDRQIWWFLAVAATGSGIGLLAFRRSTPAIAAAIVLIGLPHLIGAPLAEAHDSTVPAHLAAAFAANALAAGAVFWVLIGIFLGLAIERYAHEVQA